MGALRGPRRIKETRFHKLSSLFKLPMRRLADSPSKEQSSGGFSIALIDVSVWTNFLRGHTIYRQTILAVPLRIWRPWRW
jgi:hypothetical protein